MDWESLMPQNGWLADYIEFCRKGTDAPVTYHLFNGLGVEGLSIGRDAWVSWGHDKLYPNFYICGEGRSTWPHKSTALRIAKRLVLAYNENRLYSDRFTPEALLQELEKNSTLGIFIDEFGEFLALADKEYMTGIKGDLAELYGCPDFFKTSRSGKTFKAKDVFFTILGCTTPEWLTTRILSKDILGGLFVRFLFVPEIDKTFHYDIPPKVDQSEKNRLLISLRKLTEKVKGVEFRLGDDDAYLAFVDWKQRLEKEATSDEHEARLSPFYARMQEYCLKIGMLFEISEGNMKGDLGLGKIQHSIEIMNKLKEYLRHLVVEEFAQDGYTLRMKRIKELVAKFPGKDRRFYQPRAHMKAGDFAPVWETCIAEKLIRFDKEQKGFFPNVSGVSER